MEGVSRSDEPSSPVPPSLPPPRLLVSVRRHDKPFEAARENRGNSDLFTPWIVYIIWFADEANYCKDRLETLYRYKKGDGQARVCECMDIGIWQHDLPNVSYPAHTGASSKLRLLSDTEMIVA